MEKQTNIYYHHFSITKKDRQNLHKHKSCIVWFTGLSGSGKSTITNIVENKLHQLGISTYILDGDNLRKGLNQDLSFSVADRKENIRRVGEVSKLFVDCGVIVLAAFISPYRSDREAVRNNVHPGEFIEVYVDCSLENCENRDPKGLYKKARNGEIIEFTGISSPYEKPLNPEITLDSNHCSAEACAIQVIDFLKKHHYLSI
ncbi:adenylyl-sulfate kinase [Bacillus cereus]|uniref:adenylyl-sulfate kinase n=1 Tax=Bacillus cereus TaxID=1396 RepID=UPI000BFB978F|nr:adenylyl-sulfate kinase [Bacillus cereus]PGZ06970.1 adenylyl-sulfate kinase [Bacillus cereus]